MITYSSRSVSLSPVQLFATPRTVAHQAPLSMEFSRQEYWSGLPFASPGDLPYPGIKPGHPTFQAVFFYVLSYQGSQVSRRTRTQMQFLETPVLGINVD